jgi:hypothetical protein
MSSAEVSSDSDLRNLLFMSDLVVALLGEPGQPEIREGLPMYAEYAEYDIYFPQHEIEAYAGSLAATLFFRSEGLEIGYRPEHYVKDVAGKWCLRPEAANIRLCIDSIEGPYNQTIRIRSKADEIRGDTFYDRTPYAAPGLKNVLPQPHIARHDMQILLTGLTELIGSVAPPN